MNSLPSNQRGQAIAEYIVAGTFVMAALFLPVLPAEGGDGRTSAAMMLINAIRGSFEAWYWAMAVPL